MFVLGAGFSGLVSVQMDRECTVFPGADLVRGCCSAQQGADMRRSGNPRAISGQEGIPGRLFGLENSAQHLSLPFWVLWHPAFNFLRGRDSSV
jgi:hypothetical protein